MRGEELQELTIEELQLLEKSLQAGLSRVIEIKACFLEFTHLLVIDGVEIPKFIRLFSL